MDTITSPPLVSVVIPVYNGERTLAEAIRSVQAQTYRHWDLTIGNNHSTDRTLAIAEEFAKQDPRIRVVTYAAHVSVIDSHSTAFTLISDEAKYCKMLGADDWLLPNCLEEMVRVAEMYPSVGMVEAYTLSGSRVNGLEIPYSQTCVPGREVCRNRLLHGQKGFGGPTGSLIRADILRENKPFYNPRNYAGDIEAYLKLLKDHDLGFVHQVLTCLRRGAESRTTSYLGRVDSYAADYVHEISTFGPVYLTQQEFERRLREVTLEYYRFLGSSVIALRGREFWDYHLRFVKDMGYPPNYPRIAFHALLRVLDLIGNPKRTIESLYRKLRTHPAGEPSAEPARVVVKPVTE